MANSFFIKSKLGTNLVIDVPGGSTKKGTLLDIYTRKKSNDKNQLWSFLKGPAGKPGSFFIKSQLGNLVIDVQGAKNMAGTPLDSYSKKTSNNKNQLWNFVPGSSLNSFHFFLQSLLGTSELFIDVSGGKAKSGTPLIVSKKKSGKNDKQQLWTLVAAPGNSHKPRITKVVPVAGDAGITVSGTGFFPFFPLLYTYHYVSSDGGDSFSSIEFMSTWADFAGNFTGYVPIENPSNLSPTTTGYLTLTIQDGQHAWARYSIGASWNGTKFTINSRS